MNGAWAECRWLDAPGKTAQAGCLAKMPDDFHLYRQDRRVHWGQIVACLRAQPEALEIPLANIERWLARGRLQPTALLEWKRRILLAQASSDEFAKLLSYLEADNDDAEPIKSCSPFVGLENAKL